MDEIRKEWVNKLSKHIKKNKAIDVEKKLFDDLMIQLKESNLYTNDWSKSSLENDLYTHKLKETEEILKKDPNEYISKLRFHQSVRKASEYGL